MRAARWASIPPIIRNDAALGIAIGNFANEMTALYVSQPQPLTFTDEAIPEGIGPASRLSLKFGVFFFDYDLDGWLDLLSANGHLEEEISKVQASQRYAQPAQLFWNAAATHAARLCAGRRGEMPAQIYSSRSSVAARPSPTSMATAISTWC